MPLKGLAYTTYSFLRFLNRLRLLRKLSIPAVIAYLDYPFGDNDNENCTKG